MGPAIPRALGARDRGGANVSDDDPLKHWDMRRAAARVNESLAGRGYLEGDMVHLPSGRAVNRSLPDGKLRESILGELTAEDRAEYDRLAGGEGDDLGEPVH